jgi:hypothetical protein
VNNGHARTKSGGGDDDEYFHKRVASISTVMVGLQILGILPLAKSKGREPISDPRPFLLLILSS